MMYEISSLFDHVLILYVKYDGSKASIVSSMANIANKAAEQ